MTFLSSVSKSVASTVLSTRKWVGRTAAIALTTAFFATNPINAASQPNFETYAENPGAMHGVFRSDEAFFMDTSVLVEWQNVQSRSNLDNIPQEWARFIQDLKASGKSGKSLLKAVNRQVNKVPYQRDEVRWQRKDYWATFNEFVTSSGDCEDFALAKYNILKLLGVPKDAMRISVVYDTRIGDYHAVLTVNMNGAQFVLDNQTNVIWKDKDVRYYAPVYSVNEHGWWAHNGFGQTTQM